MPIFFVKKKDGSLQIYVDYYGLNKFNIKYSYPLFLLLKLLNYLNKLKIFTKIDLQDVLDLLYI